MQRFLYSCYYWPAFALIIGLACWCFWRVTH